MTMAELKKLYASPFETAKYCLSLSQSHSSQKMTAYDLHQQLHTLSPQEKLYKQYYLAQKDPAAVRTFFSALDAETIVTLALQFPEYGFVFSTLAFNMANVEVSNGIYPEQLLFGSEYRTDIALLKHPCYSPVLLHKHGYFEAVFVQKGSLEHTISGRTFSMGVGDFCLLSPEVEHGLAVFDDETIVINLLIRRSTFENIFYNLLKGHNVLSFFFLNNLHKQTGSEYILFHTGKNAFLSAEIFDLMLEYENKDRYYSEILNSKLVTFFAHLLRKFEDSCEFPPSVRREPLQAYKIVRYLQENYKTATLQSVAEHFHYSPEYTSRLIKSTTGKNFTHIQREVRMEHAVNLLLNTTLSVADIGDSVGYSNPEHFIRTFKKLYQQTPGKYRESCFENDKV